VPKLAALMDSAELKLYGMIAFSADWTGPRKQHWAIAAVSSHLQSLRKLERAKGFEPSTPTLARLCSTPELRPRSETLRLAASRSLRKRARARRMREGVVAVGLPAARASA